MTVTINVSDISELRNRTGAGLADCKKALIEAEGDMSKASELLRQKGLASASKKAGKVAAEGAVIAKTNADSSKGVLLELNSQTDFVAKNEKFQALINDVVNVALSQDVKTLEELKAAKSTGGETVEELISLMIAQIGEKIELRRFCSMKAENSEESIFEYTHPIGNKIAVLGKVKGANAELREDLAMHIAAHIPQPEFVLRDEIPQEVIENEKRIEMGKEDLANKPEQIKEKIVQGRVEKVLLDKVLLEQVFVKDSGKKIKELLSEKKAQVIAFERFNLGEGVEKKQISFADEVAAQTKA